MGGQLAAARGAAGGARALWDVAAAGAAAVGAAPGRALLLVYCFTTLSGVAPLALHYGWLTACDATAKDAAAARRGGMALPIAGPPGETALCQAARNCGAALFGPLPPSRVWARRSGGGLEGSRVSPAPAPAAAQGDEEEGLRRSASRDTAPT